MSWELSRRRFARAVNAKFIYGRIVCLVFPLSASLAREVVFQATSSYPKWIPPTRRSGSSTSLMDSFAALQQKGFLIRAFSRLELTMGLVTASPPYLDSSDRDGPGRPADNQVQHLLR